MPITHEWNGTILTITSDSGTSSADLKGEKGDDGARGVKGEAGDCVATDTAMLGGVPAAEYALKLYVDEAIANVEAGDVDLTAYATKAYVEERLADIETGDVDLTDYATKAYVDEAISNIETGDVDLSNYYTKAETNAAITNAMPELDGYLLKTDTAANANKLGGVAAAEYALKADIPTGGGGSTSAAAVAYNLLDNSNFKNIINQRGQTTYSGVGYTIDRWRLTGSSHTLTKNDYSITVNGELIQYIAGYPAGKTFSFFYGNETETIQGSVGYDTNNGYYYVSIPSGTWTWAALYEGEYTTETMPKYMPKGYAVEMLECQRYFFALDVGYLCFGSVNQSGSVFYGTIETPAEMRITPSISTTSNKFSLCNNESQVDMTGTLTVQRRTGTIVQVMLTVSNTGMKKAIVSKLWFTEGSARGYLVADL